MVRFNSGAVSDHVGTVTYGGVGMTEIGRYSSGGTLGLDTYVFYLGASVLTGTQAVVVNRDNNSFEMWGASLSVTAAGPTTEIYTTGIVTVLGNAQDPDEQSVNDGSPGADSLRICALATEAGAGYSPGANSIQGRLGDFSGWGANLVYEATPGEGARPVGVSSSSNEFAAWFGAIREVIGATAWTQVTHRFRNDDGILTEPA